MKLINVIYKLRNIIKNYRKYRYEIVYDRQFINIIEQLIIKLLERAYHYRPVENLVLEGHFVLRKGAFPKVPCMIYSVFYKNNTKLNDKFNKI